MASLSMERKGGIVMLVVSGRNTHFEGINTKYSICYGSNVDKC